VKDPFTYQTPTPEMVEVITYFREACKTMRDDLREKLPAGRYRSLAETKLEEFSMWVNKGIVFEEPDLLQEEFKSAFGLE
jgi:hypothetical protein